jgi:5-methylcytosine-specific restriction endonuclease McrA
MGQAVLVLNQDYEPLNVCHTHRAIGLLLSGKAEIIQDGRGYIVTPTARYPRPSVLRLLYQVRRPRPHLNLTRRAVFRRDNFTCLYCGLQSHHLTIDHIIPRHHGGKHTWENVVSACPSCNRRKGSKTLTEAHMQLRSKVAEPSPSMSALFAHYLDEYHDWEPFISAKR